MIRQLWQAYQDWCCETAEHTDEFALSATERERIQRQFAATMLRLHSAPARYLALLRRVEWAGREGHCPLCCASPGNKDGHAAGCELAAALREA